MDLEEFEVYDHADPTIDESTGSLSIQDTLKWIDAEWHIASRRARWMDLLGDYAGVEPFIIDGHSLIQSVIDDPLLALAKPGDPSFQILHAFHTLERTLGEFVKRAAVFDIVFFKESRHHALRTGASDFEEASRSLARKLLFNHLLKMPQVSTFVYSSLSDSKWKAYRLLRKPMFILINDGSTDKNLADPLANERFLCHRAFLCDILTSGLAIALLNGSQFRDSKISSFVYESKTGRNNPIPASARETYSEAVQALEDKSKNVPPLSSTASAKRLEKSNVVTVTDVALKVASQTKFPNLKEKALLFAFLVHLLLLDRVSTQDRARRLEDMQPKFKTWLSSNFLPGIFRSVDVAISSLGTTVDLDVRVFIALLRFLAENSNRSLQDLLGDDIASIVKDKLSPFSVPISSFAQFAEKFRSPPAHVSQPTKFGLGLLSFSNKIFDEELAPIHGLPNLKPGKSNQVDKVEEDEGIDSEEGSDVDEWDTSGSEVDKVKEDEGIDREEGSDVDEWDTSGSEEEEADDSGPRKLQEDVPRTAFFDDGTLFNDTKHWHNHKKALLPKHLGGEDPPANLTARQRQKRLKNDQRYMKSLHDNAATLTGASGAALHQIKISSVKTRSNQPPPKQQKPSHTRPTSKTVQKQSKADVIREQNLAKKAQKQLDESSIWLKTRIRDLDSETLMSSLERSLSDLKRNKMSSEPFVATELALYRLHRLFKDWISDSQRESQVVRDRLGVTALRTFKDILEINYSTSSIQKCIGDTLNALGFTSYTKNLTIPSTTTEERPLTFKFVELLDPKTQEPVYPFMRIKEHPIEWQLRVFGEYMDRSMDSQADPRVQFKPDAWQMRVLDAIDERKSLLVVAPTSAGKTFISFYAMEKILRESNEGVLVYVAPTKALVNQVAAEVYARFSKDLDGRSCWAIHTRDYRIHDPQNCQILVTVPEMLAIMMLSPPLAKVWTPHVKYIILDEIHTIGQQEGGSVWEQILLLAPCPVIGLSATVGAPEKFNTWLESVQKAGGFEHAFIHHPHRYSHLRKFFYNIYEKPSGAFESLSSYKSTGRMRLLHPIAMLAFGPRSIPSDLALEASDTLTLYQALVEHGDLPPSTLDGLSPEKFFPADRLLQQKDVIAYDEALKACLTSIISKFDLRDREAPLYKVITSLEDPALSRLPTKAINSQPRRVTFKENLIYLVCDLHVQGDLPAIFFNFDRTDCEIMAQTLVSQLADEEEKWRASSPEWQRKLAQYRDWLSRAKDRERAAARAAKNKADPDDVKIEATEWQATFDPSAPSPQFSFAGQHTSYSPSKLDEDIADLTWRTKTPDWAFPCLRRGIAVHHAGMNRRYRSLVESLFRQGFIRVIFATSTLALGINAPTRTSVFCGDSPYLTALTYRQCAGRAGRRGYDLLGKVVFYGLPMDRVQRLTLSKLPSLGASFPITSTLILRLFNLLEGSEYAPAAVKSIQRFLRLPQVRFGSEESKYQLLHHLRFSIDYLRRARLLDERGRPFNLCGIASQLYYTEPSNFALVALLRQGVLHRICGQSSNVKARRDFILLMSHLFGRRHLPATYLEEKNTAEIIKNSASIVILPPLSKDARRVLAAHEEEILQIFTGYAVTYGSQHDVELGPDDRLMLSNTKFSGTSDPDTRFGKWLRQSSIKVVARSLFVANSGHDDRFESVEGLARTSRRGLSLNEYAIPSFAPIFKKQTGDGFALNAYILDFYTHGQPKALSDANAIRRGDVWYLLQDFALTLMTVRGVLEQLIMQKQPDADVREGSDLGEGEGEDGESEGLDSGFVDMGDPTEKDDEGDEGESGRKGAVQAGAGINRAKPAWVTEKDWRVLEVVHEATVEFEEKFRAMWA